MLQFKKLENSAVGCWKGWVPRTLAGKPFSMRDSSQQMVLGASTPTIRQTNLSQRLGDTPLPRTFGLAGLTQMEPVHAPKRETFCDSVVSGPATALTVCRKMLQNLGDPKRWFAEWAKELSIGRVNRAWHEMHTPIDIFYQAGCCDQLNMGALACMELFSRRLQQHTKTFAHEPDTSNCASAKTLLWQQLLS